ncbi:MAG: YtxH domain-containing protein [Desulfuromonadaceae bacterium]
MTAKKNDIYPTLLTFISGAALGAGVALLLAPKTGKNLQGTIEYSINNAFAKIMRALKAKDNIGNDIDNNPPTHI